MVSAAAFTGTGRHRAPYWNLRHAGQAAILTGLAAAIPAAFLYSGAGKARIVAPPAAPPAQAVVAAGAVMRPQHRSLVTENRSMAAHQVVLQVTYRVRRSDSLSAIAAAQLGSAKLWPELWWLNRHKIGNPSVVPAGITLKLVPLPPRRARYLRAALAAIPPPPPPAPALSTDGQAPTGAAQNAPQAAPVATSSGIYSYAALEALWVSAGGPASAEAQAAQIATCESGGNPAAYNPSGATGLWQILGSVVPGNLDNPAVNAANAVAKFNASGGTFAQWVCQ